MENDISRRGFICAGIAGAAGAVIGLPTAQAAGSITIQSDGRVKVDPSKFKALSKVGGVVVVGMVKEIPSALIRTGKKSYQGIDLRCTHQDITTKLISGSFQCPAHGSEFTKAGIYIAGPAEGNLRSVKIEVVGKFIFLG